jgi:hypothetical protein
MSQSTELAGFIQPSEFTDYVMEQSIIKNALIKSGIVVVDPLVSGTLAKGGGVANVLTFKNIDVTSSANVTTSNQASSATPKLVTGRAQKFPRIGRNDAWSAADWDRSMLGTDPAAYIGNQVAGAIIKWRQAALLDVLKGITGATSATNTSNISAAAIASYTSATQINAGTVTDFIVNTWGDFSAADQFSAAIAMHSKTYGFLNKNDYTAFTRPSAQTFGFTLYLGMPVIVDDSLPVTAGGTDGFVYTSYIVKAGAIKFGYNAPKNATEVGRLQLVGDGGGADVLSQRDEFGFYVPGLSYTGAVAGDNITAAELYTGSNWTQVYDGKAVGVGVLKHNLAA